MRLLPALVLILAIGIASTAHAQNKADAETLAAARRYLELTNALETMKAMIPGSRAAMISVIAKANPSILKEVEKAVDELILPEIVSRLPEMLDVMTELYALHFSAAELQRINQFYETPEGQKLAQSTPIMSVQGQRLGNAWGQRVASDALNKAAPKLRERGINL